MTKTEIRRIVKGQRALLSLEQIALYSQELLHHFSVLDFSSVKTIHIFLPIAEKKEPDTFLFIDWLQVNHPDIKILVPKADFDTALMQHYVYEGRDGLEKNLYDILEPAKGSVYDGEIDLVLVPLLAFDCHGYRVGYGKGFYDRFLTGLSTRKIGLSFFEPIDNIEDVHENDIRLDACITPLKMYSF
jgi:5-formyltetrahydrofolate cyclo-ligase